MPRRRTFPDHLSSYTTALSGDGKIHYQANISVLNDIDHFTAGLGEPVEAVPPVDASELPSYLVLWTNFITNILQSKHLQSYQMMKQIFLPFVMLSLAAAQSQLYYRLFLSFHHTVFLSIYLMPFHSPSNTSQTCLHGY